VFYVYLVLGISFFGAGILLTPGWYKLLWIAGCVVVVVVLPAILEKVLDPFNARRITKHLASTGATDISVKSFPNHYGVNFKRNGTQRYAKCSVKRGQITVTETNQRRRARDA
jgi:hypothetical protein